MTRALLPSARVRDIAKLTLDQHGPATDARVHHRVKVLFQLASAARLADQSVLVDLEDFALIADNYVPMK